MTTSHHSRVGLCSEGRLHETERKKLKLRRQVYFPASDIFDFINIFVEKVSNKTTQCKHDEGTDNQSKQTCVHFTSKNVFYFDLIICFTTILL